jgi:periplasmic divalent cation tolerance protein
MAEEGIVFMTAASQDEAERIANHLVENRLAACVNIISSIKSIYWWEGKICDESEVFFIAKTTARLYPELEEAVKMLHSYKVPEVIFIPIQEGSKSYLDWIREVTK